MYEIFNRGFVLHFYYKLSSRFLLLSNNCKNMPINAKITHGEKKTLFCFILKFIMNFIISIFENPEHKLKLHNLCLYT